MQTFTLIDLHVVDVCGTLVRDDTTLGLLKFHFARPEGSRIRYALFNAMTARGGPVRLVFAVIERLTGRHLLKHAAVRLLAGERADALAQSAEEYAATLLENRCVESVWQIVKSLNCPSRVMLASASLEPIVARLADEVGASHVASQLEEQDGILTGRYLRDLTGQKDIAILEKYRINLNDINFCIITDNVSDRPLVERAIRSTVVLHSTAHRQRWKGLRPTFIDLNK